MRQQHGLRQLLLKQKLQKLLPLPAKLLPLPPQQPLQKATADLKGSISMVGSTSMEKLATCFKRSIYGKISWRYRSG